MLLSKQQVISLGLFDDKKSNEKSKYLKYFNLIHSSTVTNDIESMKHLNYKNKASFLRFKNRYRKKVFNYLLLSNASSPIQDLSNNEYAELLNLYSVAKILHFRSLRKDAILLYQYINNLSQRKQYLDLLLFTTTSLKKHYAFIEPNEKLFNFYTKRINKCKQDLNRVLEVNHYYDEISHKNIVLTNSKLSSFKVQTLETSKKLLKSIKNDDTFEYQNRVYEIAAFAFNLNNQFEESIRISQTSLELCNQHFTGIHVKTVNAYKDILSAYLRLNDFDSAQLYLSKILKVSKTINHNFFRYKSLEFTLYSCTLDYNLLFTLTEEILSKKKLKEFKVHHEEWTIRDAFVNILVEAEKIDPKILGTSKRKFKLNRFINEVEFYSKDKRGANISVLVIQLIHFLIRKDYDKIVDRLDALNQYTFRYLRNDDTLRSNCFIKMLLKLPEAEYHPLRTERYVAKYKKKLSENPFEISMKEVAIEIIPYEHLWDIIMEILNKNLENKTSRR